MLIVVEVESPSYLWRKVESLMESIRRSRIVPTKTLTYKVLKTMVIVGDVEVMFVPSCSSVKRCEGLSPDFHCAVLNVTDAYLTKRGSTSIVWDDIITVITKHFMEDNKHE